MIFRRAEMLQPGDDVRLDERLWTVAAVRASEAEVTVELSRIAGDQRELDLRPGDMVLLASY